ncbi:hypothetical protein [Conexibacter sp. DBS9H8]|uniref:hypothetical protein n=1 Tax=Conexibacter sp. DBS9H8 TaxID=2937801 RepID=UPI00200D51C2|nr:hypothetical protein [Conexibacter sp. DBS9H8]
MAAGSGYGGTGTSSGTPTGFSAVLTVKTFGPKGGRFKVRHGGGTLVISEPKGAAKHLQIAITGGKIPVIRRDLPKYLQRDKIITAFGIQLRQGARYTSVKKPVTVSFSSRAIKKGEKVLVFDTKTGHFRVLGTPQRNGHFVIRLKAGETVAVVQTPAPKKHKK